MKFCTFNFFYKDKVHGVKDGKVERKVQPNKDNSSANKCLHTNVTATEDISPVNQTNDCLSADSLETGMYSKVL